MLFMFPGLFLHYYQKCTDLHDSTLNNHFSDRFTLTRVSLTTGNNPVLKPSLLNEDLFYFIAYRIYGKPAQSPLASIFYGVHTAVASRMSNEIQRLVNVVILPFNDFFRQQNAQCLEKDPGLNSK